MSKVHFFKALSRLGIIHLPYKGTAPNLGVENAPDEILTQIFLEAYTKISEVAPTVDSFAFSLPENIDEQTYAETIVSESNAFKELILDRLQPGETQVVIGGDHSVAFGSIQALMARTNPQDIFYVHFDSHSDQSSFSDSPTGNFHGIFARALLDKNFDHPAFAQLTNKLLPSQTMLIGNLEADDFEFIHVNAMRQVNLETLRNNRDALYNELRIIVEKYPAIHVGFDIDIFDHTIVSATGTPSPAGFFEEDVFPLLEILAQHPNLSIDLVEVNPQKQGAAKTIDLAQRVLVQLLAQR